MFVFEIWGKFAAFRDPLTISQNITLPLPPKTTVAGMMASILGIEDYFEDEAFKNFEYSVISLSHIKKKSFSQNYINDYTSKVQTHLNSLKKADNAKVSQGIRDKKSPQKPINRELLLNPHYLIVIKDFAYEEKLVMYLKERMSKFAFYMGNSEFAGNYRWVEIEKMETVTEKSIVIDSFVLEDDLPQIIFEEGIRYTNLAFATYLNSSRIPQAFRSVTFASQAIKLEETECIKVICNNREFHCKFI